MRPILTVLVIAIVAIAALCAPARAQLILTEGHTAFDANGDGSTDISFFLMSDCSSAGFLQATCSGAGGIVLQDQSTYARSLPIGSSVGPDLVFASSANLMTCGTSGPAGPWAPVRVDAYLGAKLILGGQTHYAWLLVRHHPSGVFVLLEWWIQPVADAPITVGDYAGLPPYCHVLDFNRDGETGTDADIEDFFSCIAGNCCLLCQTADFNGDGDIGTDADIEDFFRVLSTGGC